jgi:hypothetical protein
LLAAAVTSIGIQRKEKEKKKKKKKKKEKEKENELTVAGNKLAVQSGHKMQGYR